MSSAPLPARSPLLTQKQAAKFLRLKNPGTLAVWRSTKRYPLRYVKIGVLVFYKLSDLEAFIADRTVAVEARS